MDKSIEDGIEFELAGVEAGSFSGSGSPEPGEMNSGDPTCAFSTGEYPKSEGSCVAFSGVMATQEAFVIAVEAPGASS